jgi:hypothetical protein
MRVFRRYPFRNCRFAGYPHWGVWWFFSVSSEECPPNRPMQIPLKFEHIHQAVSISILLDAVKPTQLKKHLNQLIKQCTTYTLRSVSFRTDFFKQQNYSDLSANTLSTINQHPFTHWVSFVYLWQCTSYKMSCKVSFLYTSRMAEMNGDLS